MGAQEHVDAGRGASVVPLTIPTVADIDALSGTSERLDEVRDAIGFVPAEERQRLVTELLADLDNDRALAVMLSRVCSLSVDDIGRFGKEVRELLERVVAGRRATADGARSAQRAAEVALINVLGSHAQNTQTAE